MPPNNYGVDLWSRWQISSSQTWTSKQDVALHCVRACVRACVRVRACVCACVCVCVDRRCCDAGTTWTLLLQDNAAPHKARAAILYLEGEMLLSLPPPPYSPDIASCVCCMSILWKGALQQICFCEFKTLLKRCIHNSMPYPLWSNTTHFLKSLKCLPSASPSHMGTRCSHQAEPCRLDPQWWATDTPSGCHSDWDNWVKWSPLLIPSGCHHNFCWLKEQREEQTIRRLMHTFKGLVHDLLACNWPNGL